MELCEAYRSPIPCLGTAPSRGIRRTKLFPFRYLYRTTSILNNVSISRLQIHNFTRRSAVGLVGNGVSVVTSMKLCKVLWSVEADVANGQILYLTGDPIALGCWNPEMAIPLSLIANTNLWKAEIKVPFGIHFKYNYFIKREGEPTQNLFWRSGPEFSVSIPLQSRESKNILVRDIWIKSRKVMAVGPLWGSWMEDKEQFPRLIGLVRHKKSHSVKNSTLVEEVFSDDILSDSNSAKEKDTIMHTTNPGQRFSETNQPVEEPWLYRSLLSYIPESSPEETRIKGLGQQSSEAGKLVHVGQQLVHIGESVSTIILINSSVCTMQRIAILEDGKLVELLLEPVKNNVHCDSVYLGVVTKLVPHMGGAFVDIGLSRPSLMDIKKNREPFVYPPFSSKWEEAGASVEASIKEHEDVHPHDLDLHADDDLGDEDSEVDHQDETLHDDLEELEGDAYKRMLKKGIIDYDRTNVDFEDKYEDVNGTESEVSEELQVDKENDTGWKHSELTSQDQNSASTHSNRNKWTHVRKGTKVIVQVVKEGLGTKGPALSAYPNLRSRFWILIARCNRIGVSKKIAGAERTRLRVIAKKLQPSGFGLTVRTVAVGHSLEELQKDLEGLFSTWKVIVEHAKSAALAADEGVEGAVPVILHRAMGQTLSVVQDYFNDKVKSMAVDSPRTYHEVTKYLQDIAPDLCDRVVLYNKETPIFDDYAIEEEINNILCKRVPLSNGGSLVIEQTEALVSIDVNGGHGMLGQGTSQEKAVLEVNLAAAKQIARELRLRDIGGIIVVDFIDMADESNKRLVYEEIKKAVERDKSMVKVSELSKHGLMEITRKRVRPSVSFLISEPCNCCQGTGRVEALETSFSKIEREICRLLATMDQKADPENAKSWPKFMLKVDRFMCNYLTTGKRTKLANLCSSLKVWILLKVARGFLRGAFEVKPFTDDKANGEVPITIPKLQSAEERPYIPNTKLMLFPIKKWKTRGR